MFGVLVVLATLVCATAAAVPSNATLFSSLYFAYSAFCPASALSNWTCAWCNRYNPGVNVTAVLYSSSTGARGYVAFRRDEALVVVSFQGSHGVRNWWLDLDPKKTKSFYNTTVHAGWVEGFESLRAQMYAGIRAAQRLCPSCTRFLFTGHSLGAAESGVAAVDVALTLGVRPMMINFGMPRVGLQNFASLFERVVDGYRVVHYRDIVPHVISSYWPFLTN
jgi:predicted lipase